MEAFFAEKGAGFAAALVQRIRRQGFVFNLMGWLGADWLASSVRGALDGVVGSVGIMQLDVRVAQRLAREELLGPAHAESSPPEWLASVDPDSEEAMRKLLYTLEGGAHLGVRYIAQFAGYYLQAPVSEAEKYAYLLADYNAGPFSCRNAQFQADLTTLSCPAEQGAGAHAGNPERLVAMDGDLLPYDGKGEPIDGGQTEAAVRRVVRELHLINPSSGNVFSHQEIRRDLQREKAPDLSQTLLYGAIKQAVLEKTGKVELATLPRDAYRSGSVKVANDSSAVSYYRAGLRQLNAMRRKVGLDSLPSLM